MLDILPLLQCLQPLLTKTSCRQLAHILEAMLAMTGRITQLGISRWTTQGGSYRTVQRFFQTSHVWHQLLVCFFLKHLYDPTDTYLLVGDETVVGKAGQKTYGRDWFYSSLAQRAIPGLAFFGIALVSYKQRRAFPLAAEQGVRSQEEKEQARQKKARPTACPTPDTPRKRGRPKGSQNQNKRQLPLSEELQRIQGGIKQVLARLPASLLVRHLALDGHFGNPAAAQMAREVGLHLGSKLRHDAALFLEPTPAQKQAHPRLKYGDKVDYAALPAENLVACLQANGGRTEVYSLRCWHKDFADLLHIVIILKTDLTTQKQGHVVLFSTDLAMAALTLWENYGLRFQIEFVFRDAKQHFGLDDFQAVTPTAVANAVGLSLLSVNLCACLLEPLRAENPTASVLDIKAWYRGRRYAQEALKGLGLFAEGIVWKQVLGQVCQLGSIHPFPSPLPHGSQREPRWSKKSEGERLQAA